MQQNLDDSNNIESSQLSVLIPKEIHKRAKVYATEEEIALKDLVTEALKSYLASHQQGAAA